MTKKHLDFIIILQLFLAIFPFLILILYIQPQSIDEYTFSYQAKKGFFYFFNYYYTQNTGRYTVLFTLYWLNPMNHITDFGYNIMFLRINCFLIMSLFCYSLYFFIYQATKNIITHKKVILYTIILIAFFLHTLPNLSQVVYWLIGSNAYLLPASCYLLFLGQLLKCLLENQVKKIEIYKLYIFTIIAMGCHELLSIFHFSILLYLWIGFYWNKSTKIILLQRIIFISFICSLFLFLAEGNMSRLNGLDTTLSSPERYASKPLLKLLILSLYFTISNIGNWLSNSSLWLLLIYLIPIFYAIEKKYQWSEKKHIHPILLILLVFLLFYVLHIFVIRTNHYMVGRVMTFLVFLFIISMLFVVQSIICYSMKFYKDILIVNYSIKTPIYNKYLLTVVMTIFIFPSNHNTNQAYYEMFLVVHQFNDFNTRRFEKIIKASKSGTKNIKVDATPKHLQSKFLIVEDFGAGSNVYFNKIVADYFGLHSIEVKSEK
ncbi:MAG: hypothetical protein EAZ85_04885 [Bacteroidetes bacterium]|nr:MAG: hypothetical protein EAZ85_04885 [Bacteroidota bacterium]